MDITQAHIQFCGAHGTGKTTILNLLKERQGLNAITGVVRGLNKNKGIVINERGTDVSQQTIFDAYKKLFNTQDPYVSDRSLIDVLAYTKVGYEDGFVSKEILDKIEQETLEFVKNNKQIVYIWFPIEFAIENDGVRSQDVVYQKRIQSAILGILHKFSVNYFVARGNPEHRYSMMCKYVENKI